MSLVSASLVVLRTSNSCYKDYKHLYIDLACVHVLGVYTGITPEDCAPTLYNC